MGDTTTGKSGATSVPVLRYEPTSRRGQALAPRGTIAVYLAAAGSGALATISETASGHKTLDVAPEGLDRADDDGYPATVTYAGRVLAQGVPVPRDGRPVRLLLPFAGGELDAGSLLVHSDGEVAVEAVGVRHDPPLTAVEQAALTLLPSDQLTINLGVALPGGIALDNEEERRRHAEEQRQAAEEVRLEQAMQAAEGRAEAAEARREGGSWGIDVHLLDGTIKELTSIQSVTAMLDIRRSLTLTQLGNG